MRRSTVVAGLLAAQMAVLGLVVLSVRGGSPIPAFAQHRTWQTADSRLIEGGPHRIIDARTHPTLTVDIGYADVTVLPSNTAQIDVSLGSSRSPGLFEASGPITVTADGGTVRIAAVEAHDWSMGDDRMLTVLVPPDTHVRVLAAGDIKANGLRADASFKSIGRGSITVDDYRATTLNVATTDGRIRLDDIVATHLDAAGGGDRVEGTALLVRDGNIESDGRVRLGFAPGADTRVNAQTSNGSVSVPGSPEPSVATAPDNDASDDHASSRTVRIGNGTGHLNVHASDGDITLSQNR